MSGLRRCADSYKWGFVNTYNWYNSGHNCDSVWFYSLDIWHLNYIYNTCAEELLYLLFFTVLYCSLRSMNFQARSKVKHPLIPVVLTYIYIYIYIYISLC